MYIDKSLKIFSSKTWHKTFLNEGDSSFYK